MVYVIFEIVLRGEQHLKGRGKSREMGLEPQLLQCFA